QNALVVHPGKDDRAAREVRLVFFALFDGAFVFVQVVVIAEALDGLADEVAVGHGVADDDDGVPQTFENFRDPTRGLTFAAARAHRANGDNRLGRLYLRRFGAEEREVRAVR